MTRSGRLLLAGLAASVATSAGAREHYYFHRAGVERERYAADRLTCEALAGGVARPAAQTTTVMVPQYSTLSPAANAASVAIASLFAGLMMGDQRRPVVEAVERTCMADKGYGRYKVDKKLVGEIDRLPEGEKLDRYFALAAAESPWGRG